VDLSFPWFSGSVNLLLAKMKNKNYRFPIFTSLERNPVWQEYSSMSLPINSYRSCGVSLLKIGAFIMEGIKWNQ